MLEVMTEPFCEGASYFLHTHVITLPGLWPSHYTENLIAKLSFAHFEFFSPPVRPSRSREGGSV